MSVPLDRLYNFLHDVCDRDDIIIYRFFPHGSRKISDLVMLEDYNKLLLENQKKFVIYHDQEPLNFELYNNINIVDELSDHSLHYADLKEILTDELYEKFKCVTKRLIKKLNLKLALNGRLYEVPIILVHSEQRSSNLQRYQSCDFIPVYWWCHALLARDWFRYAEVDPSLEDKQTKKDFLIYNRAWSGTREYRLKFAEMLIENNLYNTCLMGFNSDDHGNYKNYQFANQAFQINRYDLENYFHLNTFPSTASADYVGSDYRSTEIEVVLETLFDDDRLQLTEKILRPIACGQPFMLVSTHGSLSYLRDYGFETFGNLIDEHYDTIVDPAKRLEAVINEMKRIADLSSQEKLKLYADMRIIAQRNKELFFSQQWQQQIVDEYKRNFSDAYYQLGKRLEDFKTFENLILS
jgi:hypothetical protein